MDRVKTRQNTHELPNRFHSHNFGRFLFRSLNFGSRFCQFRFLIRAGFVRFVSDLARWVHFNLLENNITAMNNGIFYSIISMFINIDILIIDDCFLLFHSLKSIKLWICWSAHLLSSPTINMTWLHNTWMSNWALFVFISFI